MRKRTAQLIEEHKAAVAFEPKRKPRGKPFAKGNKIGHRFQPGESGNPGGLPGTNVSERIARAVLARFEPQIVEGLGAKLCKGDGYVFSVVADRADGKVKDKQQIEVTGPGGKALAITIKMVKGNGDSKSKS